MSADSIFNMELINMARRNVRSVTEQSAEKRSFVPAGGMGGSMPPMDPAAMGGGGGMPPMDPAAMGGGMPPMDPAAMGGGMPPMDPMAMGGGGGAPSGLEQKIDQLITALNSGGGGGAGGANGLKPKIDVNVAIVQMQKMLAKIMDTLGISMPMADMITTAPDLNSAAQQQQATGSVGASGEGGAIKPIAPLEGLQGSGVPGGGQKMGALHERGRAVDRTIPAEDPVLQMTNKAAALLRIRNHKAA